MTKAAVAEPAQADPQPVAAPTEPSTQTPAPEQSSPSTAAAAPETPAAEQPTPAPETAPREFADDDIDRFLKDRRVANRIGNLAQRQFTEWKSAQERLTEQATRQAELDQLAETNPREAYQRVRQTEEQLARDKSLIAAAFGPVDQHLVERYNALPDKFKQDFGFTPSGDPVKDRTGFIDAVIRAETAHTLDGRLKKAEEDAFEAGRAAERAERGKTLAVPDVGANGQGGNPNEAMTQEEYDRLPRTTSGGIDRAAWAANKPRILAGQKAGLITH